MKSREIFQALINHLAHKQITVITGMRRVGKTTAIKYLLDNIPSENKMYLDLEKVENRFIFNQTTYKDIEISLSIEGIDFTRKAYIAIDEIQLVKNLPSVLKYFYDNYDVKFIVTGSSSFYIKNHFTESLAGRKSVFEMFPLSFSEYLSFKDIEVKYNFSGNFEKFNQTLYNKYKSYYLEYLQFGGFPEVVTTNGNRQKVSYLKDIINSYIELDIKLLSDFSKSDLLYKIIKLLTSRAANKIEYSNLGAVLNINQQKIKEYILLLEYTYFIRLIRPYSRSADREISQQQKLYFADNGILTTLADVTTGVLLENSVANQLARLGELNYFAKKTGQEIDFILNKSTAFEVKETPVEQDLKTLLRRAKSINIENAFVIGLHPAFDNFVWAATI
jgi:uncharacterized protein